MRRIASILAVLGASLTFAGAAQAAPPGTFVRAFGDLPAFTAPTDVELRDLAQTMLEGPAKNQPVNGKSFVVGQFIDHDLTRDESPPTDGTQIDIRSLDNVRNANFDLDSVHGDGPQADPQLYEADGKHLRVGVGFDGVSADLPRDANGNAIVGDGRNDENLVIAQLHAAFLRAHNRLVDGGASFAQAQSQVQGTWKAIVTGEYLPQFAPTGTLAANRLAKMGNKHDPVLPIEFNFAFRFCHSCIRNAYNLNDQPGVAARPVFVNAPVANLLADNPRTLLGGRRLPVDAGILWDKFFDIPGNPVNATPNLGRRVDTDLSASIFALPIGSVVAGGGSNVLGFRNMQRSRDYGIPSYEAVARSLGVTPVDVRAVVGDVPASYPHAEFPLWFGLLAESEAAGGETLGPTGSAIVRGVIGHLIARDEQDSPIPGVDTTGELLKFAGVA